MAPWGLFHIWLWFWFTVGMAVYMLKRAYYLVTGPNPVANSYKQFVQRCWIPLLFNYVLKLTPWSVQIHSPIPQYAVVALFFGMGIDSIVDFAVTKIPWLNGWLPQMPGPIHTVSPTDKQIADDKAAK